MCSPKRRFELELHDTKSQKSSITFSLYLTVRDQGSHPCRTSEVVICKCVEPEESSLSGLVTTDVSEELRATIIRVTRIGELGMLVVISSHRTFVTRYV
jgi:hypothetical protein